MTATRPTHGGSRIDYETETAFVSHDWSGDDSLAETIIATIADLSGSDPAELDRLYDRIDPDSLETIFAPANGSVARNSGRVSFRLDAYEVTVHASGAVVVTRPTE
ncbi:HalOD1 output domain-containing protein [Halopiger thermotolerans]